MSERSKRLVWKNRDSLWLLSCYMVKRVNSVNCISVIFNMWLVLSEILGRDVDDLRTICLLSSAFSNFSNLTRHVFVKHGCPGGIKVKLWQKSLSPTYWTRPPPGSFDVSEVWGTIDEFTVQVWLLYHRPNFKYCSLLVSRTELRTDKQTNRRTIQFLDAPSGPFRPGA